MTNILSTKEIIMQPLVFLTERKMQFLLSPALRVCFKRKCGLMGTQTKKPFENILHVE